MRFPTIPVLCAVFSAPLLAGEPEALKAFADARARSVGNGDTAPLEQAIDALSKDGGAKSLDALGRYMHDSFVDAEKIRERIKAVKVGGSEAFHSIDRIGRELEHLRHRQQSGATGLGPEIDAREAELSRLQRQFEEAKLNTNGLARTHAQLERLRERCTGASIAILARLPAAETDEGIRNLRAALEVSSKEESLLLVRILRQSKRVECGPALLEVYSHPQSPAPTRVEAACAIAASGDREALRTLLERLDEKDEEGTKRILHAVSRTARRKLATVEEARKWVASKE